MHEFATAVVGDGRVTDEQYRSAVLDLGERAVVELVALLGYYSMVAFTLNVFEIPAPAGAVHSTDGLSAFRRRASQG